MNDIVSLEGVHRRFGKVKALDGLSLTVREGEVYGFLGRNGAGKTTTLRILMGILSADSGTVSVLGQRGKRLPTQLKQRIGYVSQEQHFYPWMTAQQLGRFVAGFYPTWDEAEFRRLLKVLDVPYTRRSVELSGGSRTKLGLALALAPRPALLLLDEPTAGLDPVARREFNDLVATTVRERGTTAFFSSHLVDEVQQIAHRVAIIQAGSTRFEGEVATLRASVRKLVLPTPARVIELRGPGAPSASEPRAEAALGPAGEALAAPPSADATSALPPVESAGAPPLAAAELAPPTSTDAAASRVEPASPSGAPPPAGADLAPSGAPASAASPSTAAAPNTSVSPAPAAETSAPPPTPAPDRAGAGAGSGLAEAPAATGAPPLGAATGASSPAPALADPAPAPSVSGTAPGAASQGAASTDEAERTGVFTLAQVRPPDDDPDPTPPPAPAPPRVPILYFHKAPKALSSPPEGFTRLRGDVWRALPGLWESTAWPEGTVIDTLSLEDIFLAFARTDASP